MFGLVALTGPTLADERVQGRVTDHYRTITEQVERHDNRCEMIDVPIYEEHRRGGNAAGGALLGMIIGGATGKVITGKDNGAAAGAVIGGIIGADQGSRGHTDRRIVGYRQEKYCTDEVWYEPVEKNVYSHSTLVFTIDGKRYSIDFNK